ncbi:EF-hand calcium-binding domain-containing protein 11 [Rhea pennata]|uniref:EF-hand calcium-binding domain-containing protein 11 n=1 Tax=Rhea pennata TaxID=8795 RepID=UPI002E27013F
MAARGLLSSARRPRAGGDRRSLRTCCGSARAAGPVGAPGPGRAASRSPPRRRRVRGGGRPAAAGSEGAFALRGGAPLRPSVPPVFEACDEDNKSYLSRKDFKVAVVMFGYKPSKVYISSVMSSVQPENSGILLKKFLNLVSTKKTVQLFNSEARHIFTAFDMQGRGFLTSEDFKKAFNLISPKLSERIVVEAFREVDQDSDGHVSFKEFESAMKYGEDEVSTLYFA